MNLTLALLLMATTFALGYVLNRNLELKRKKESVTTTLIESRLADCSDLTTCNMIYVDLVKYEKGSIPLVTKKSFSMIYQANIRAGIDLSKADVSVTPSTVTITLPETEVQSIEVDTSTLRFYDERLALFNWSNKEDISAAIAAARLDAEEHANLDKLKMQARSQAESVIYKLIRPAVDESREVVIR